MERRSTVDTNRRIGRQMRPISVAVELTLVGADAGHAFPVEVADMGTVSLTIPLQDIYDSENRAEGLLVTAFSKLLSIGRAQSVLFEQRNNIMEAEMEKIREVMRGSANYGGDKEESAEGSAS